jgi:hypothetical protein
VEAVARGKVLPQRFTGRFENHGDTFLGRWEKAEDGTNYETEFDLIYGGVKWAAPGPSSTGRLHARQGTVSAAADSVAITRLVLVAL